jgi:hypothetical protein
MNVVSIIFFITSRQDGASTMAMDSRYMNAGSPRGSGCSSDYGSCKRPQREKRQWSEHNTEKGAVTIDTVQ